MVEFDTVNGYNEESDTNGNHIGINLNGMNSTASLPASYHVTGTQSQNEEVRLETDGPIQAWIDYDGLTKTVNVTVSPLRIPKPARPLMSEIIDLSPVLLENMYAGFSAATGEKSSAHYILGWSFRLNGTANPLNLSHLPLIPIENLSSSKANVIKKALIATFSVLLFILLGALGVLPSTGAEIAVKKIMSNNKLQGMREFAAEIESLGRLRHKNLVNLQGWCKHKNDLLLIYDYIPNGSLDSLLYDSKNVDTLTWNQRFNILKGVASGLLYLHEEWEQVVVHRDVKSSNVLIDRDMNARLGDFGLARLYDHGKNAHTTNVVGTIGYIAPELTRTGKASTSTDVFAYGILLLEVACGRGPVVYEADRNVILVDWVSECVEKGNIFDAVDVKLGSMYVVEEMELVLGLGLLCSHPKAQMRPSMRQVMKYLNGDEVFPLFDKLSLAGSRRVDEMASRFLALGLSTTDSVTTTASFQSHSVGAMSSTSFDSGR
ncbi:hypothetical protein DH2020_015173 [Rehmannia glutinosa]|uniref:Protein kinase domain-containing protein n=1 Tax=Rehmannia glutinosa TaxID=99300 RepID=A0ABR0WZZ6_REHGL